MARPKRNHFAWSMHALCCRHEVQIEFQSFEFLAKCLSIHHAAYHASSCHWTVLDASQAIRCNLSLKFDSYRNIDLPLIFFVLRFAQIRVQSSTWTCTRCRKLTTNNSMRYFNWKQSNRTTFRRFSHISMSNSRIATSESRWAMHRGKSMAWWTGHRWYFIWTAATNCTWNVTRNFTAFFAWNASTTNIARSTGTSRSAKRDATTRFETDGYSKPVEHIITI